LIFRVFVLIDTYPSKPPPNHHKANVVPLLSNKTIASKSPFDALSEEDFLFT
jgi:hypothetical protein